MSEFAGLSEDELLEKIEAICRELLLEDSGVFNCEFAVEGPPLGARGTR